MLLKTNVFHRAAMAALLVFSACAFLPGPASAADDTVQNPVLKDPQAIKAGRLVYSQHCIVCHGTHGGRGPNLFKTPLSDEEFLAVVMAGRQGSRGQMPAWAGYLTVKQVWQVEAFVKSRPHF